MNSCCKSLYTCFNFISCRRNYESHKIADYNPNLDYENHIPKHPDGGKRKSQQSISSEQSSYPSQSTVPIINERKSVNKSIIPDNVTISDQEKIIYKMQQPCRYNKSSVGINPSTPNKPYHHKHTRSLIGVKSNVLFPSASTVPINVICPSNFNEGINKNRYKTHHRSLLTESLPDDSNNKMNNSDCSEMIYAKHSYTKCSTYGQKKIELSNTTDDPKSEFYNKPQRKTTPNFFTSSTIPVLISTSSSPQPPIHHKSGIQNNVIVVVIPPQQYNANTEVPMSFNSAAYPPSPTPPNNEPTLPSPIPIAISEASYSGDERNSLM